MLAGYSLWAAGRMSVRVAFEVLGDGHVIFLIGGARSAGHGEIGAVGGSALAVVAARKAAAHGGCKTAVPERLWLRFLPGNHIGSVTSGAFLARPPSAHRTFLFHTPPVKSGSSAELPMDGIVEGRSTISAPGSKTLRQGSVDTATKPAT